MRLTELLGLDVSTVSGEHLGRVHDALLIQDGPMHGSVGASFRLHALAVGRRSLGARLGFVAGHVTTPAILDRFLGQDLMLVPWAAVIRWDAKRLVVANEVATTWDANPAT
jgi:hypothetical protein